jgi:hypothetical protein
MPAIHKKIKGIATGRRLVFGRRRGHHEKKAPVIPRITAAFSGVLAGVRCCVQERRDALASPVLSASSGGRDPALRVTGNGPLFSAAPAMYTPASVVWEVWHMSIHYRCVPITAAAVISSLAASTMSTSAGPCTPEIERLQAAVDAIAAEAGPAGRQTTAATTHHQPTPASIAVATLKLEEAARARRAQAALAEARAADGAGDRPACQRALADLRRETGR